MAAKKPRQVRGTRIEVELMMECMDDDLSPWQREANKRAEQEYKAAMQRIQAAKAGTVAAPTTSPGPRVTTTTVARPERKWSEHHII